MVLKVHIFIHVVQLIILQENKAKSTTPDCDTYPATRDWAANVCLVTKVLVDDVVLTANQHTTGSITTSRNCKGIVPCVNLTCVLISTHKNTKEAFGCHIQGHAHTQVLQDILLEDRTSTLQKAVYYNYCIPQIHRCIQYYIYTTHDIPAINRLAWSSIGSLYLRTT